MNLKGLSNINLNKIASSKAKIKEQNQKKESSHIENTQQNNSPEKSKKQLKGAEILGDLNKFFISDKNKIQKLPTHKEKPKFEKLPAPEKKQPAQELPMPKKEQVSQLVNLPTGERTNYFKVNEDGTITETIIQPNGTEIVKIVQENGDYTYEIYKPGIKGGTKELTESGSVVHNEDGTIRETATYPDGSTSVKIIQENGEYTFEKRNTSGVVIEASSKTLNEDGGYTEKWHCSLPILQELGKVYDTEYTLHTDGTWEKYENGELVEYLKRNEDGSTTSLEQTQNGSIKTTFYPDGSKLIYEVFNGTTYVTYPDGTKEEMSGF